MKKSLIGSNKPEKNRPKTENAQLYENPVMIYKSPVQPTHLSEDNGSKKQIWIAIIISIILIAGLAMFIKLYSKYYLDIEEYRRVYNDPIEVVAVVYDYDSYDDDGDTDYRSYIKYEVSGKTYDAKYEDKNKIDDLTPIGQEVKIKVSPENPANLITALKSAGHAVWLSGLPVLLLISLLYKSLIYSKRSKITRAHLDNELVRKDLILTVIGRMRNALWLLFALFGGALVWRYPMLYDQKTLIFAAVSFTIWVVFLVMTIIDCRHINNNDYRISYDKLIDKNIVSGEDSDSYVLTYKSDIGVTWKVNVSLKRYNQENHGDIVHAVYLYRKQKPILHYDKYGKIGK